jgi:hypothetical protein
MEENLNEGRTQIKRQYGQYSKIKVNEKAPVRNKVIGFVGKRFVTEEEMKNFLSKMNEESGKTFDDKKWFGRNQRYFESFENRGQKVITLSKYGKRVLEMIGKTTQKQSINESIGLFKNIKLNETTNWEDIYEAITVEDYIEYSEGDDTWIEIAQNILTLLKLEGKAVYWVTSEDEDPKQDKLERLQQRAKTENVTKQITGENEGPDGKGSAFYYDLKTPFVYYEGQGIQTWILPINIYKKL